MKLGYGLDNLGSVPSRDNHRTFSFRHRSPADSEAHPSSYPVGTGGSFSGDKAAEAWSWPFTSI